MKHVPGLLLCSFMVLCLVCTCLSAESADTIHLRYQFKNGAMHTYRGAAKTKISMIHEGKPSNIDKATTVEITEVVLSTDAAQVGRIATILTDVETYSTPAGEGQTGRPKRNPPHTQLLLVEICPNGEPKNRLMNAVFGLHPFPDRPLKVGESWKSNVSIPPFALQPSIVRPMLVDCLFEGMEKIGAHQCAKICANLENRGQEQEKLSSHLTTGQEVSTILPNISFGKGSEIRLWFCPELSAIKRYQFKLAMSAEYRKPDQTAKVDFVAEATVELADTKVLSPTETEAAAGCVAAIGKAQQLACANKIDESKEILEKVKKDHPQSFWANTADSILKQLMSLEGTREEQK